MILAIPDNRAGIMAARLAAEFVRAVELVRQWYLRIGEPVRCKYFICSHLCRAKSAQLANVR